MCNHEVPVFFTVTFIDVLVPWVVAPKSGLFGFIRTAGVGVAFAFPLRPRNWGESGPSFVTVTLAVRKPAASGVNTNVMVHVAPTVTGRLQVGSEKVKSPGFAPLSATLAMCNAAVPVFVTVTFRGVLVPTTVVPKSRVPGTRATAGAGARPVPPNWADSVLGDALSVIVNDAERLPVAEGAKVMSTEQELLGCKTVGTWQVSDSAKSLGFIPVIPSAFRLSA